MPVDQHPTDDTRPIPAIAAAVLVAVGAFAGATLRYGVGLGLPGPAGTLVVNVAGSLLLGSLLEWSVARTRLSRAVRLALGTGLLSSFTTYSAFALDVASLDPMLAVGYVLATYGLGFGAVLVGRAVARIAGGDSP